MRQFIVGSSAVVVASVMEYSYDKIETVISGFSVYLEQTRTNKTAIPAEVEG